MKQHRIETPAQAQQQRQSALDVKIPPGPLTALVAALMWLVAWALPELHFFLPAKTIFVAGLALVGAVIAAAGIVSFRVAKTTVNPMKPERASSLIVSGPYKYTRNPMYVGMVFALLGWAAFLSNFAALAGIPLFILYLNRFQIEPEERVLDKLFPHEFPRYRAKVRRWL